MPGGALELISPAGSFGQNGAYVVVESGGRVHAARAPIHERFRVYVDPEGVLRTDHVLRLWSATVVAPPLQADSGPGIGPGPSCLRRMTARDQAFPGGRLTI